MKAYFVRFFTILLILASMDILPLKAAAETIPYEDSVTPIRAEQVDRILNIHMSTSEEDGSIPLSNIILDIYRVATAEQLENEEGVLGSEPTEEELSRYRLRSNLAATLMTDAQGNASFNFTQAGQPDGIYLVSEQYNPATAGVIRPFYITIPEPTEDGRRAYTISKSLNNLPEKAPDIRMDITGQNQKSGSFDIGQPHTWIIRSDVPTGIVNARQYSITDILDSRLTWQQGSVAVRLYTGGTETELQADRHYTLTEEPGAADGFCIALTPDGMAYVAAMAGREEKNSEIRVYVKTAINKNTAMGATIPNDAHLDYTNSAGIDYDADSDIPEVHTGGLNLLRTNADGVPMTGVTFMIARESTQAEMERETVIKEVLQVGNKPFAVVFVDFYTADAAGEKVYTVTTGEDGKASIFGLAYGTYFLVETAAAPGSDPQTAPIKVVVNEASHLTKEDGWLDANGAQVDNTLHIATPLFVLPYTGGIGTTAITLTGILLLCAACFLLLCNRKRRM